MSNLHWPVYMNLEKELLELSYSIYFDDNQFEYVYEKNDDGVEDKTKIIKCPPYSLKVGELLVRACTEIEALIKTLSIEFDDKIKGQSYFCKKKGITTGNRLVYLNDEWELDKRVILVANSNFPFKDKGEHKCFAPFDYEKNSCDDYYSAYNAVKHNRSEKTLPKGNIRFLLRAMGALYLLNVYFRNESYPAGTIGIPFKVKRSDSPFEESKSADSRDGYISLGSNLFAVKYRVIGGFPYKGDELHGLPDTYVGIIESNAYEAAYSIYKDAHKTSIDEVIIKLQKNPELVTSLSAEHLPDISSLLYKIDINILKKLGNSIAKAYLNGDCIAVLNRKQSLASTPS